MISDIEAGAPDLKHLLALNNAHAAELSWLEPEMFEQMIASSFAALRVNEADAFLLAFDQGADYGSPNFQWFRARLDRFVYVDRVVVSPQARGHGLARRLYTELFARARAARHDLIACEVNREPANPASDAFHAALNFREMGTAAIHGGAKTVRYLVRRLEDA